MDTTPDTVTEELPEPEAAEETAGTEYESVDLNEDGSIDALYVRIDQSFSFVALDSDEDTALDTAYLDLDGDGQVDVLVTESDGGYLLADASGNSEPQWVSREDLTAASPELVTALDQQLSANPRGDETTDQPIEPDPGSTDWSVEDGVLIGDPVGDSEYWFQQAENGFCLPASIAQIVSEYTGVVFTDEMEFVDLANEIGAFSVGHDGVPSMSFEKGVEILNAAGVPAEMRFGDLDTLAAELEAGNSIILAVDSGELWTGEASEDNTADHAVVITGINTERGTVILSDPGSPGGNLAEVPIGLFLNSWADSQNAMIVCDEPPADAAGSESVQDLSAEGQTAEPQASERNDEPLDAGSLETPDAFLAGSPGLSEAASAEPLEATTSLAIQNPWVLLPITLAAATLKAL
ncbi:hypothetical protein JOE40_002191 [Arthrobacter sp. PvP102]|uniref:C39 family peptidase n=1 Tax=unclassified Arthrobacter TaxID=235627 RepID=UPI001AE9E1CD|nr:MULTISPECIES: C39 family peptidase [unclassified Arthrobacter]MBP1232547.1 hypothetical protein [Arthrobacter sp. PvP103]MBP1237682.1 hypothetical protein [Arthrobacter sp. PvP102]